MENRILTFDSLIEYCKKNNVTHFSKKESGKSIVVSTFGDMDYSSNDKYDFNDPGLMPVTLKSCHCGKNVNMSSISDTVMAKALPSFKNKPILAEIKEDGDFGSHAMEYIIDENGEWKIHYIERAVGIVPESCNAHLEYDKERERMYTIVDGYIFNYYGNETADIIKRKNGTKVSVELEVNEFEWSEENDCLDILDFTFSGVTLLSEKVECGMEGSRLDISKLPEANMDYSKQMIDMQNKLDKLIDCFNNKDINGKEEMMLDNNNIELEDAVDETVEMSVGSTEEDVEKVEETEPTEDTPEEVENTTEEVESEESKEEAEETEEKTVENNEEFEKDITDNKELEKLKAEYEEYKSNHSYTNEEYAILEKFKADTENAQMHSEREAILTNEKYAVIAEKEICEDGTEKYKNEEYAKLVSEMDNYSLTDLEKELKSVFADYVTNGGHFSIHNEQKEVSTVTKKVFASSEKETPSRYGNLFSK